MIGWIVAVILFICLIILYFYFKDEIRKWEMNFENRVNEWTRTKEKEVREDAIKRSSATRVGKEIERLIPFTSEFPYDPRDVRWLGDPIDLVIFGNLELMMMISIRISIPNVKITFRR